MLYETYARTDELLQINIEDLDLAGRCCQVKSKGAKPAPAAAAPPTPNMSSNPSTATAAPRGCCPG
jgi:hypothetical protein